MINIKELKHDICKKYDISAEDIDDVLIPVLYSIDIGMIDLKKQSELRLDKIDLLIKEISTKTNQSINVSDKKIALYLGLGMYGPIAASFCFIFSIIYFRFFDVKPPQKEKNFEYLKKVSTIIKINENNQFYIENKNIIKLNKGIILKTK